MKNFELVYKGGITKNEDLRVEIEGRLRDGRKLDFTGSENWKYPMPLHCIIDATDQNEDWSYWQMALELFYVKILPDVPEEINEAVAKVASLLADIYKLTGRSVFIKIFRDGSGAVQGFWCSDSKQQFDINEEVSTAIEKCLEVRGPLFPSVEEWKKWAFGEPEPSYGAKIEGLSFCGLPYVVTPESPEGLHAVEVEQPYCAPPQGIVYGPDKGLRLVVDNSENIGRNEIPLEDYETAQET